MRNAAKQTERAWKHSSKPHIFSKNLLFILSWYRDQFSLKKGPWHRCKNFFRFGLEYIYPSNSNYAERVTKSRTGHLIYITFKLSLGQCKTHGWIFAKLFLKGRGSSLKVHWMNSRSQTVTPRIVDMWFPHMHYGEMGQLSVQMMLGDSPRKLHAESPISK